jgi:glycosyltransferase involved in cell wall biosynthesis
MKKIFLFDPTCLPYRQHVYSYLIDQFKTKGYELSIFYDSRQANINLPGFTPVKYSFLSFLKLHLKTRPDISIFFIWLRYKFSLPFLVSCRLFLTTKVIVWSKGINILNISQPVMNLFYYIRQMSANALILYSDFERQFIKANLKKVFTANNTINQYKYRTAGTSCDMKKMYQIKQQKSVLFVGRIEPRKRLDMLVTAFSSEIRDHALVIVGPGIDKGLKAKIEQCDNIYYLGPIYELDRLSELYSSSDLFCMPGHIGLGINEAFLFGLPVVTATIEPGTSMVSSEPLMLFRDKFNGLSFKPDDQNDFNRKLVYLLENDRERNRLSKNARKTFEEKAKIEYMFQGFLDAIEYVQRRDK